MLPAETDMRLDPDFMRALKRFDIDELNNSESTILGVRPDFTVGFRNKAWYGFANHNGGTHEMADNWAPPLTILDGISPLVKQYYADLFTAVMDTREATHHEYLCPSPEFYRRYRLKLLPLDPGLLLVHQLQVEKAHEADAHGPDLTPYRGRDGMITVCCHCRVTRRANEPDTWDWVPEVIREVREDVSHGMCPMCFRHYHPPELVAKWDARKKAQKS